MRLGTCWLVGATILAGCADQPSVSGPTEAPSASLLAAGRQKQSRYIVTFRPGITNADALADYLVRSYSSGNGKIHHFYNSAFQGFAASLPPQAADGIRHNPFVESVEADAMVEHQAWTTLESNVPWGLDRIDQRVPELDGVFLHNRSGSGVTVYIIDSGLRYSHTEFGGRASFGFDSYGGDGSDCNGHGTHVGGTVGGSTHGVAPEVQLVSVRVLGCSASGYVSSIIAGIDWVARNAKKPAVANLSLGSPAYDAMDRAVRGLVQSGVTAVVAASNYNADACNYSPARERSAITVAASNSYDLKASFSNWGPCVDIFAPGYAILSADFSSDAGVVSKNGTSMAAPHVTGAAALFLETNPYATPEQVDAGIRANATVGVVGSANSDHNDMVFVGDSTSAGPQPPPPPPPAESGIALSAAGGKERSKSIITLSWSGAAGEQVQVIVNDAPYTLTANTGSYVFQPEGKGRKSYLFQICEVSGELRCSGKVSINY